MLVGGGAGPKLFAHIAEYGDGWIPIGGAGLAEQIPRFKDAVAAAGRDPEAMRIVPFGSHPSADKLEHFAEIGVTECVFRLPSAPADEVLPISALAQVLVSWTAPRGRSVLLPVTVELVARDGQRWRQELHVEGLDRPDEAFDLAFRLAHALGFPGYWVRRASGELTELELLRELEGSRGVPVRDPYREPARAPLDGGVVATAVPSLDGEAVYAARRFKYVMMNAPEANLDEIKAVLPGLKAPTVIPLEIPGWVAVHAAIQEDVFWEKIEQLRHAGASEILVSALDKLLL